MDAVDYRDNLRASAGRMRWWREVEVWRDPAGQGEPEEKDEELVEVLLRGKAPWGFTLRGGSEHREPLVITKVEEGSVAAVCLQAGDEMVSVNAVPLSGSRQEVISLVKSSHRTLTLVVRRKNDPGSRPHSWHSSKLTEEEPEPGRTEATPGPVWQPKHEASRPKESSSPGDQKTQHRLSSQLSSGTSMERLEPPAQPFSSGRLSPMKYPGGAEPLCGPEGKRDSGMSCFGGSSPPVHDSCRPARKGTSTENIFFKGLQAEGSQQAERPRYLQPTLGTGGWEGSRPEEQAASRVSVTGRPGVSPVWQVPEKKKSQSPPPPPPPLRSDSFAVTKVFPYPEGSSGPAKKLTETQDQNGLRSHQDKTSEARRSLNPLPTKDLLHPGTAADHNHNQLHPGKLFSLSSSDIRQPHHSQPPAHHRQYSDESPLYLQTRSAPPTKIQSVGSYYRSLQDLPTNAFGRKQVRHSAASMAGPAAHPNLESGGHGRYYGQTGKHPVQTAEPQTRQGKAEGRRAETEKLQWGSSLKSSMKTKYFLPQFQVSGENKERHEGHHALKHEQQTSELPARSRSPEDAARRGDGPPNDVKRLFQSTHQNTDHVVGVSRHQDPWVPQEDHRISPLRTPLLHSLAQESRALAERQPAAVVSTQDAADIVAAGGGKSNRRSDRYATTLRNEIQEKRAQLQKSRSAATLTCDAEDEEAEEWRSTKTAMFSGVSFSNTYKDHLKEAQARVLQATSFQRRDLEPLGPDVPLVKTSNGRVRGRKRFPLAKRTHSFSEPDKIDKVGVEGESQTGSFGERRKFFEAKPAFSRPVMKSSPGSNLTADPAESLKAKGTPEQVLLEQQRLGTFAEYQATWSKQKKSSEAKTQGRYHSAENILDADAEEKAVCVHERSRSSPSADFYTQNTWRDPHSQQGAYTGRGKSDSRLRHQAERSPPSAPPASRNEAPVSGAADHRTKPDAANPSHSTLCSGPRIPSPGAGSQPPQTQVLLPPPRPHLGLETTSSSSQELLVGAQAQPAAAMPQPPSDTQHQEAAHKSPAGPSPASSPRLRWTPDADVSRGGAENQEEEEEEEEQQSQPPRSSSPLLPGWTAALPLPADRARSPSPQFAPLRLTDKPPAALVRDDSPLRPENDVRLPAPMDPSSPVRKVPVRIVHSETRSERDSQSYLPHSAEACSLFEPPPLPHHHHHLPSLSTTERPTSSLFSAYVRQPDQDPAQARPSAQESGPELNSAGVQHSEEDAKREELARDIMGKDKSLVDILDQSGRMTTMDLMEGLFPSEEQILEGALQRRGASGSRLPPSSPRSSDRREEDDVSLSAAASLVPSSSYYNTSAPKAELLIKMKDMQEQLEEQDSEDELDVDLASKKQELISSLAGKLEVLREARHSLQEDVEDNEALGRQVEATVHRLCQPNQLDKFRMFVGDLDKVVSLLLSLSGRLARVENALNSLEEDAPPEEKRTLTDKRKLLMRQHEDAKELKENLDRRERLVSSIMEAHLDPESLDDYRHFVKMKSALIIEQRKLEDKIKLGEEQLKCLLDSLPLEQRPPL